MAAGLVVNNGGVVRNIDFHGTRHLPRPMRTDGRVLAIGSYWTMLFDANPPTQTILRSRLAKDPRVLRQTILREGSTFREVTAPPIDPAIVYLRERPRKEDLAKGKFSDA